MDPERYQQLMDLFDQACDASPDEQRAVVASVRERDADLADRLGRLFEHDARDSTVLGQGAGARALASDIQLEEERAAAEHQPERDGARLGDWRVGERLGGGGLGTVHRAVHAATGQTAAIKFLKRSAVGEPNDVRRFEREFESIARLDHPCILRVFEQGRGPLGHYFVMEYAGGGDLSRLTSGPAEVIVRLLAHVAEALVYVHAQGIVHRDLKPANVLLTSDDPPRPKLADFGIAKVADATAIITGTGAVMGSIDYMSPEQINGLPATPQSDLYAFGCMIFSLLSGAPPFEGDNFERLYARLRGTAPALADRVSDLPPELDRLCARLLCRDPAMRPPSFEEVAVLLRSLA